MQPLHHVSLFVHVLSSFVTLMLLSSEGECVSIHLYVFVGKWGLGSGAMLRVTQRCLVITDRQTAVARHQKPAARFMSLWGWSHCLATSQQTLVGGNERTWRTKYLMWVSPKINVFWITLNLFAYCLLHRIPGIDFRLSRPWPWPGWPVWMNEWMLDCDLYCKFKVILQRFLYPTYRTSD